ncbi:hypothetical protein BDR04DRAFT_1163552 [Suillus decipiens]|nr:hypothetical protein BDR04DRAFT_1163552 [Suillus decipiens]
MSNWLSDWAAALNFAWACLEGYFRNDPQDDCVAPLLCEALASFLDDLYSTENTAVYIQGSVPLSCELLPLCTEDPYPRSIAIEAEQMEIM